MRIISTLLLICLVLELLFNPRRLSAATNTAPVFCPVTGDTNVTAWLTPIRQKFDVPGLAMAVVTSHGLQSVGAVGVRRRGTEIPVTLADRWHLGSDTKAMTATLIARLVERGQLRWDTTMAEFFPEWADAMDPAFRKVTLPQLLSHRAGLPANLDSSHFSGADVRTLRRRTAQMYLAQKPLSAPGNRFL
jgi:CubicO group peptidase (beta-lactamase class C family)